MRLTTRMRQISKMRSFMNLYPELDYSQLDGLLKHISRITKASPDRLLDSALIDKDCGEYLAKATLKFQAQITS
jgi:hypothetical protein